jgi:hypothetical protein
LEKSEEARRSIILTSLIFFRKEVLPFASKETESLEFFERRREGTLRIFCFLKKRRIWKKKEEEKGRTSILPF